MQTSDMATGGEKSETPSRNVYPKAHTITPHKICDSNQGANLLIELKGPRLKHFLTPEASRKKAGGRGRKATLIWKLYEILQNNKFQFANWVNCFSEQGGQNFTILNDDKSIGEFIKSVGCKNFRSLLRNLRNYGIYKQDSLNSKKAVLMFECHCSFKSESSTENIQQVIDKQTKKRKGINEETKQKKKRKSCEKAAYTTLSYTTFTGGLNGLKVPEAPEQ